MSRYLETVRGQAAEPIAPSGLPSADAIVAAAMIRINSGLPVRPHALSMDLGTSTAAVMRALGSATNDRGQALFQRSAVDGSWDQAVIKPETTKRVKS